MGTFYNETPWRTEDLTAVLGPIIRDNFVHIKVTILNPSPGVEKEKQVTSDVSIDYYKSDLCRIQMMSPKRVAARTDLLDKLSTVTVAGPGEILFPSVAVARLQHQVSKVVGVNGSKCLNIDEWQCLHGKCNCTMPKPRGPIRGNTKARTKPKVTLKALLPKMRYLDLRIASLQEELQETLEKKDRLQKRIDKLMSKEGVPQ